MPRKLTKKAVKELRMKERSGPFQAGAKFSVAQTGPSNVWARATSNSFQEGNHDNWIGIIDAQHARATTMGLQTATQAGYGLYDLNFQVNYRDNPDDGEAILGKVKVSYIEPTSRRAAALMELYNLERLDDMQGAAGGVGIDAAEAMPEVNPLLATPIQSTAGQADDTPVLGSTILRLGYDEVTPDVVQQSSYDIDSNADGDTADTAESQKYCFRGDASTGHIGILGRYEAYLNPLDSDGVRSTRSQWAFPVQLLRVEGETELRDTFHMSLTEEEVTIPTGPKLSQSSYGDSCTFRNIAALGGLIKVEIEDMGSVGQTTDDNDIELSINLTCKKWVSL